MSASHAPARDATPYGDEYRGENDPGRPPRDRLAPTPLERTEVIGREVLVSPAVTELVERAHV
jgi:hypothetical protein